MTKLDVAGLRADLSRSRDDLYFARRDLEEGLRTNKELASLQLKLKKAQDTRENLNIYIVSLEKLQRKFERENVEFQSRRIESLASCITENLGEIFPLEGFTAKFKYDFKNRANHAELQLFDRNGRQRTPRMSEGKFAQELISYSGSFGLTDSLGSNKMYMDEAFAAADSESLGQVSALLQHAIDAGMQIVLIEQSADSYKHIPRREIHWVKNFITGATYTEKIIDM